MLPMIQEQITESVESIADFFTKFPKADKPCKLQVIVTFKPTDQGIKLSGQVKTSLPQPDAFECGQIWGAKEGGTIKVQVPQQQEMFKEGN